MKGEILNEWKYFYEEIKPKHKLHKVTLAIGGVLGGFNNKQV